jgi:hypothetical protein
VVVDGAAGTVLVTVLVAPGAVTVSVLPQALTRAMEPMVAPPTIRPASLRNSLREILLFPVVPTGIFSLFSVIYFSFLPLIGIGFFGDDSFFAAHLLSSIVCYLKPAVIVLAWHPTDGDMEGDNERSFRAAARVRRRGLKLG